MTLRTTYPYGVSNKISDNIKSTNNQIVDLRFLSLKRMYGRVRGTIYVSRNNINGREFIFNIDRYVIEDSCNVIKFLPTQITSQNKKLLKNIASCLSNEILILPCNFKNIQWYNPASNSIDSKLYKPDPRKINGIH